MFSFFVLFFTPLAIAFQPKCNSMSAVRPLRASEGIATVTAEELEKTEALYDLVYVERISPPEQTSSGLFLPVKEDPPMHLAKVISVGTGLEGESGCRTQNKGIKPGDYVYTKFPWGIGPKDEQCGEDGNIRRFSFIRYQDIAAVLNDDE
mmetsp:Transcript_2321/g.3039  ORF Transcript_2321/g.3039 Transcript_2321/m.3039 type:complete len:150 (+) Transcript_2321:2-451(+)